MTLRHTLESPIPLAAPGVEVGVVVAATAPALEAAVARRVRDVLESPPLPYPVRWFAASRARGVGLPACLPYDPQGLEDRGPQLLFWSLRTAGGGLL